MLEVKSVARYIEESGEVEVCSTGLLDVSGFTLKVGACSTVEVDLDSIIEAAGETKSAVEKVIGAAEQAVKKLEESGIEYDAKLIEALALKAVEDSGEVNVTVTLEKK